jgi:hypothetical protein
VTYFFKEEYVLAKLKHAFSFCKLLLEMKMKFALVFIYVFNNTAGRTCLVGSITYLSVCKEVQKINIYCSTVVWVSIEFTNPKILSRITIIIIITVLITVL